MSDARLACVRSPLYSEGAALALAPGPGAALGKILRGGVTEGGGVITLFTLGSVILGYPRVILG